MSSELDVGQHPAARGRGVTAVLGPTNTGKTHLAIERMLGHSSGIIGLPLRLLAREVYDRLCARAGAEQVALVTGEEKIKPASPRYWVSTVEAMPRDLDVAFVAVDEVQLAADFERGHVFTDRILRRRGREETLLLGAATMRPILTRLMPGLNVVTRPRLSQLSYAGQKKLTRLPARSAIVAFSADEVYAIAELIRRQRGGAAVVLGALSPRTRNAQVEMYQSGDVDFLIATDAIGMGLNLDVNHVAFASKRKFDGYQFRELTPVEMGQVAGRAGRHLTDGTFGVTGRVDPLEQELVERLESHDFPPVQMLQWRNPTLDFSSLESLVESLAEPPREDGLTRALAGDDVRALEAAARENEVRELARGAKPVELLWDVCQVPDYRKIAPANHAELVVTLYRHLMRDGALPEDWFASQIAYADRTDGDLDTLSNRIAHIRTWTFIANRAGWLADPAHWQETTRAVEDRLSDALHERLTQRFVDRRTAVLARRLRENAMLDSEIDAAGEVTVEGAHVGTLSGLHFTPTTSSDEQHRKAISAAARKTLSSELTDRAEALGAAKDKEFALTVDGAVTWRGATVGRVEPGDSELAPRVTVIADELLAGAPRQNAEARLGEWLNGRVRALLGPLLALGLDDGLSGITRGLAFQLVEAFGILERERVANEIKTLAQEERAKLRRHGVRFGAHHIFLPLLMKPAARVFAAQLWALGHGGLGQPGFSRLADLARSGRMSVVIEPGTNAALYRAFGFRPCGGRAIRVDILERLADHIRAALSWREGGAVPAPPGAVDGRVFAVSEQMTSLAGCAGEDFAAILTALGYRSERRPNPAIQAMPPAGADFEAERQEQPSQGEETGQQTPAVAGTPGPDAESGESTPAANIAAPISTPETPDHGKPVREQTAPQPADQPQEATVEAGAGAAPSEATQLVQEVAPPAEIVVWRPARRDGGAERGQDRQKRRREERRDAAGSGKPFRRGPKKAERKEAERPSQAPAGKPDKKIDPLSPFAKLASLREELTSRQR